MPFIGKLLRKTEPLRAPAGRTAPLDESMAPAVPETVVETQSHGEDDAERAGTEESVALEAEQGALAAAPAIPAANDSTWWQESAPAAALTETPASESPIEAATPKPPAAGGTQPLAPIVPAPLLEAEIYGTRPLTA